MNRIIKKPIGSKEEHTYKWEYHHTTTPTATPAMVMTPVHSHHPFPISIV